jgi:Zn-dependent protease with chaperone function
MILALLAQSILHALIAALFVEALVRRWRIEDAAWRLRLRILALLVSIVGPPVLLLLAPFRQSAAFAMGWALFAGERWDQLRVGGNGLGSLTLLLSCGLGSALFLRDALPPLADALRGSHPLPEVPPWHGARAVLTPIVSTSARAFAVPAPALRVVQADAPVLLCEGVRHPALVVSPATIERLSGDELDAAVAHEMAHAVHRDPAWSYALIVVRAALFFNPAVQWVARAMVDDLESRADQAAVRATGGAAALARVIRKLFDTSHPPPPDGDASFERVFWRIRREGVERRCASLQRSESAAPLPHGPLLLAMAGAVLVSLLFFVV